MTTINMLHSPKLLWYKFSVDKIFIAKRVTLSNHTISLTANAATIPISTLEEKAFDTSSIHGVVDHNLITFDV